MSKMLTFEDYQESIGRTTGQFEDPDDEIAYWIKGLLSACHNLEAITVKHTQPFGTRQLETEARDVLSNLTKVLDFYGLSLEEVVNG